jgi:hypothetical protein
MSLISRSLVSYIDIFRIDEQSNREIADINMIQMYDRRPY